MKIGIVIGIKTDAISEERYPEWLEDIPQSLVNKSKESWGNGVYGLGSDAGVAYYVQKYSEHEVSILTKKDIHLKKFNEFDVIIGLYEPYYLTNQTKDSKKYAYYNQLIRKTKATFLQPLSLQKFVLNKELYMNTLRENNIPVVDHVSFMIKDTMNVQNMLSKITKSCESWNTSTFISKPQPGGFGIGFKKWKLSEIQKKPKLFEKYIQKIQTQVRIEKPKLLVQPFIPEFETFYEVRTYWLNGKYSHSLGTMIDPQSLGVSGFEQVKFAYPENEYDEDVFSTYDEMPEIIDQSLVNKLKRVGKKVIQALPKDKTGTPFLVRVDFGCCLQNKNICRDYFVNEIEYVPNLFPEYSTHQDVLQKVGKAIIQKINTL